VATIGLSRNVILSLKDMFEPILVASGYDISFVSAWVSDDKIVKPEDYVDGQGMIKLPAAKMTVLSRSQGSDFELGGESQFTDLYVNVFVHAITEGQLYDLLDLFHISLTDGDSSVGDKMIAVNDYTVTGYPTDSPVKMYEMEFSNVNQRTIFDLGEQNLALQFAGSVGFSVRILRRVGV